MLYIYIIPELAFEILDKSKIKTCKSARSWSKFVKKNIPVTFGIQHQNHIVMMHKQICIMYMYMNRNAVVSSLRQVIKPGYGLAPRSHTFSSATTTGSTHIGVPVRFFANL